MNRTQPTIVGNEKLRSDIAGALLFTTISTETGGAELLSTAHALTVSLGGRRKKNG